MSGVNKVILIGNLGDEPTLRTTQNGTNVANASLCTTETFKDQNGNKQESAEWHRLVFWGRLADIVGQYLHKGSKIYVEGKIQSRQYEDKEGIKRTIYEIVVNEMQMLDSKGSSGNNNSNGYSNNNNYGNNNKSFGQNQNGYGQGNAYGSNNNAPQQTQQMPQRSYQPQMSQNQPVNNFGNAQSFGNNTNTAQQNTSDDLPF